ncbi:DNA methyltransferase [Allobaculum sp. Allo2]|uniref:DNA methyltransferase n=1 Tax=Allobaculum sp. Allo2 TaxID=2853432 RepID=UPI001F620A22|nr:DNA methyltransferase [Allobaculum sp. Allo2]UNT93138.1 site-specific DNA-methyltransferase [Allobaculum sp. Allo2]
MKRFLSELKFDGMAPTSIMFYKDVGHSQEGAKETSALLGGGYFDGPKPVRLLKRLMTLANLKEDSIVLDFFSGSASLAQAVMEINRESGKTIQYILVQIPETVDSKSKAYEAGYRTICDIGIDRIKKATGKIYKDNTLLGEIVPGFRVFELASSNMKDIYYSPNDYQQYFLSMTESNIKEDRTDLDLLLVVFLIGVWSYQSPTNQKRSLVSLFTPMMKMLWWPALQKTFLKKWFERSLNVSRFALFSGTAALETMPLE